MIKKALSFFQQRLQEYIELRSSDDITSDLVQLSAVMTHDGKIEIKEDSIMITLINIEEEFALKDQNMYRTMANGEMVKGNPELKLNLFIMVAANYGVYSEGLKFLSYVLRFFQANRHFTQKNSPGLDSEIEYMMVELYTLNFEQINQLWGALGAKYRPSAIYKVRMLSIHEDDHFEAVTAASQPGLSSSAID